MSVWKTLVNSFSAGRYVAARCGIGFLFLLTACSTARMEQAHYTVVDGLEKGEAIVVLARTQHGVDETEDSFMDCLNDELEDSDSELAIIPADEFVDQLFPWFEPRTAPASIDALTRLFNRSEVSDKIEETGVRYLIWVDGDTDEVDKGGGITCTVTPAGGGCFGLSWWDKESVYEAAVWDMKYTQPIGKASADVFGTSYMPALILPIPLIARTENTACEGLATQVKELIGVKSQ